MGVLRGLRRDDECEVWKVEGKVKGGGDCGVGVVWALDLDWFGLRRA